MSKGRIKVSSLKANPDNPRKWDEKALAKLAKSIEEFPEMMNLRPIITHKGIVIGGNMRLAAIRYLGMTEIPASWVKAAESLTKEQIKEFVVKDNVGFGAWDYKELINFAKPTDLTNWGMNAKTINSWRDRIRKVEDDENQPTAPSGLKIKTGDLIDFEGGHSIICADAKDRQAYTEILGETKADLLITDPPYGVDYTGKTKDRLKIDNDDLNEIELKNLFEKSLANSHLHLKQGGGGIYLAPVLKNRTFCVGFFKCRVSLRTNTYLGEEPSYSWQTGLQLATRTMPVWMEKRGIALLYSFQKRNDNRQRRAREAWKRRAREADIGNAKRRRNPRPKPTKQQATPNHETCVAFRETYTKQHKGRRTRARPVYRVRNDTYSL